MEELMHLPAVYRHRLDFPGIFPTCEQLIRPYHVHWRREAYCSEPGDFNHEIRKGNFEGEKTIQITAAKDSTYRTTGLVPLNRIMPAESEQNFDMLQDWLRCCLSTHESCQARSPEYSMGNKYTDKNTILLMRVIDVGSSWENEPRPHLLQTKGAIGAYMAFSHCWGSAECQLRTESSTLERFKH